MRIGRAGCHASSFCQGSSQSFIWQVELISTIVPKFIKNKTTVTSHKSQNETIVTKCFIFIVTLVCRTPKNSTLQRQQYLQGERLHTPFLWKLYKYVAIFHSTCNSNCKFIKIQSYESEQSPHCTMYNYSVKIVSVFVHKHYYYTL